MGILKFTLKTTGNCKEQHTVLQKSKYCVVF